MGLLGGEDCGVALQRILVVHDSPAVRETVGILLAGEYDVHAMETDQFLARRAIEPPPDLLIAAPAIAARPLPDGVAVLWVEEPGAHLPPGPALPQRFSPRELRRRVAGALARPIRAVPRDAPRTRIEPPYVPAAAARVLAEAVRSALPLHLAGEPGVGKRAAARAVHGAGPSGQLLVCDAGELDVERVCATPGASTLYVTRVEALARPVQHELLAALTPAGTLPGAGGESLRLITATTGDLADALDSGALLPELYYRLTLLSVRLPALRERGDELPALAQHLAGELARALGRAPVALTERALERLRNYLWFGNVSELEAVLARSLALTRQAVLDADDLLFDGGRLPRDRGLAPEGGGATPLGAQQLDLIINELAHEFKNPLVTLKTFAHHLRRTAAANGGDTEQVARLTGEAVAQIDHTLENLLEFTRLEAPALRAVPLAELLDAALEDGREALAARGVRLDCEALPLVLVSGDPQHVTYALGNLLRALARDLAPDSVVQVTCAPPTTVLIHLPDDADPLGNHLATLLDRDAAAAPSLGVAIANAVLARNGAHVAVAAEDPRTVVIRFTPAEPTPQVTTNGSTTRTGR